MQDSFNDELPNPLIRLPVAAGEDIRRWLGLRGERDDQGREREGRKPQNEETHSHAKKSFELLPIRTLQRDRNRI